MVGIIVIIIAGQNILCISIDYLQFCKRVFMRVGKHNKRELILVSYAWMCTTPALKPVIRSISTRIFFLSWKEEWYSMPNIFYSTIDERLVDDDVNEQQGNVSNCTSNIHTHVYTVTCEWVCPMNEYHHLRYRRISYKFEHGFNVKKDVAKNRPKTNMVVHRSFNSYHNRWLFILKIEWSVNIFFCVVVRIN